MHTPRLMKTLLAALASLILFGGLAGNAIASTPDGETPANEGVCDSLHGGTPGLYGLCVAYCEAQDLDVVGDKPIPNSRILANYRKKMNAGDPDMPCLQAPCPCWDDAELANITATGNALCNIGSSSAQIRNQTTFGLIDTGRPLCRYVDTNTATQRLNADFPADEAQSCYNMVVSACAAIGQ